MEKLHDRPDKVAKKAIQKGDWRFILSAMAAERRLLRLRMVSLQESNFDLLLCFLMVFFGVEFFLIPSRIPSLDNERLI